MEKAFSFSSLSLLQRNAENPILTAREWPYPCHSVFNPGAIRLPSGETLLLCRVEDQSGFSHLCAARSPDGVGNWHIDAQPTWLADAENFPEEARGIEDPRIVRLEEIGRYAVTYTAFSAAGPAVSLALTEDFRTYERLGVVLPVDNKDAALFPRKINGLWAMLHRPFFSNAGGHIWLSYSPDLRHWGAHRLILSSRQEPAWDTGKIGLAPPLIETTDGWLLLYHGVKPTAGSAIYRMGAALLDLQNPETCLFRGTDWILGPREDYERTGDVPNVVFPSGCTLDGDRLNLYYGAADTSIALATGSIRNILAWLKRSTSG